MSLVLQDQLVLSPATADHLQEEIDAIEAASDVADVVGNYEELEDYDTSALTDKDVIKVLDDETHDHAQTYWRYSKSGDSFTYIGQIAKPAVDSVNGKTGDVVLTYSDVDAQQTLVSGTNIKTINGNNVLGSGDLELTQFLGFPSDWPTTSSTTTKAFCDVVAADADAIEGKMYLGEVRWSDLNTVGLVNAEVVVKVMKGTTASNKVIVLTMTSGNHAPYQWQYTYWNGGASTSGWIGFVPSTSSASKVYGTDTNGNQTTYNKDDFGKVDDVQVNGVSVVTNKIANVTVPDPLPSQSGNAGKFLKTDGTNASWGDALQNTANGTDALTILGTATNATGGVNIGKNSEASNWYDITIGYNARAAGQNEGGVSIGYNASTHTAVAIGGNTWATGRGVAIGLGSQTGWANRGIVIGYKAKVDPSTTCAIQLGGGSNGFTNSDSNTFKVGNANGNYEMMSADGTIPTDRFTTTPVADGSYVPTLTISSGVATRTWGAAPSGGSVPTLTWYTISTAGTTLTIADTSSAQLVKIYKNGLLLQPTEDYTISGTTLTTVSAMVVGDKITTEVF